MWPRAARWRICGKRIADVGLEVASVIGFAEWIVDDEARRANGLEQAKRIMDMAAQIGGRYASRPRRPECRTRTTWI